MFLTLLQGGAAFVMLLPALAVSRLLLQPGARRRLMIFAPFGRKAIIGLGLYFVLVGALLVFAPKWLVPAAVLTTCGILVERWQARVSYGRSKGLPPGSLSFVRLDPWRNQDFFASEVAQLGPVFKTRISPRPMIAIYGLERARKLLSVHDRQLGPGEAVPFDRLIPGGFLRNMERTEHNRLVALLRRAFSAEMIAENREPARRQIVAGLAEANAATGTLSARELYELMFPVFCGIFFNIWDPQRTAEVRRCFAQFDVRSGLWRSARSERRALRSVLSILGEELDSLTSIHADSRQSVLAGLAHEDPSAAFQRTVLGNLVFLAHTSWLDVSGLMVWLVKMLTDNPRSAEAIRVESETNSPSGSPTLSLCAVKEVLRLEQSEFLSRTVIEGFEFEGFRFPRGWRVRILEHENHRDPAQFERADEFWPERFRDSPPPSTKYAPFGASRIHCLGEHLTLALGELFVHELCSGYDWSVVSDGPPEFGGLHWQPNADFRVKFEPRPSASAQETGTG